MATDWGSVYSGTAAADHRMEVNRLACKICGGLQEECECGQKALERIADLEAALKTSENKHVQFMVEGGPVVMASEYDALKEKVISLDWSLIGPDNLPKIGDEVGGYFTTTEMTTWEVTSVDCEGDWTSEGYTHRRPINAPKEVA